MKHIEISLMEDGELSIDGQVKPAGNLDIREFEDGEWTGGCYATYDNLVEKVKEALGGSNNCYGRTLCLFW